MFYVVIIMATPTFYMLLFNLSASILTHISLQYSWSHAYVIAYYDIVPQFINQFL